MLRDPQEARAYEVPAVEDPLPADWERVARWRQPLATGLVTALTRLIGRAPQVVVSEPRAVAATAATAVWASVTTAAGGAQTWRLVFAPAAVQRLAAIALGLTEAEVDPGGTVAQAVWGLLAHALGQAVGEAVGLPAPFVVETQRGGQSPWAGGERLLGFEVDLEGGPGGLIVADWHGLRAAPAPAGGGLGLQALEGAQVALEARLPGVQLTARDLWELQPGDVIRLGPVGQEVNLCVEGRVWARGRPGARGEKLAVSVHQTAGSKEGN